MQLSNKVNLLSMNLTIIKVFYQLLQVWQLSHNFKVCDNHENALIISNRGAQAMQFTKNHVIKVRFVYLILNFFIFSSVIKELLCKFISQLYQQIKASSSVFSSRDNHERMTLSERLKSDERNSYIDVLFSFNLSQL